MPGAVGHRSALYVNMGPAGFSGCPCPPDFPEFKVPMPPSPVLFLEDFEGFEDTCDLSMPNLYDNSSEVKPVGDSLAPIYTSLIIGLSAALLVLISGFACGFVYCRNSRRCSWFTAVKRSDSSSLSLSGNYPVAKSLWTFSSILTTTNDQGGNVKTALVPTEEPTMNLGMAMYGGIQLVKNSPVSQNSAYYQARAAHLIADKPDKKSVEDCYYQARKPLLITDKTDKKIPDESYYHTRKLYQTPMPASDKTEEVHYMCTPLNTQLNFNSPIYEEIGRNLLSRSRNSSLKYNKPVGYTITSAQSTPGQVRSSLSCDKTLKLCDNNGDRRTYSSYKRPKPKPLPRQKPMKDQFTQSEEILSDSDENYQLVDIGSDNSTKDSSRTDGNLSLLPTPQQFQSQLLM